MGTKSCLKVFWHKHLREVGTHYDSSKSTLYTEVKPVTYPRTGKLTSKESPMFFRKQGKGEKDEEKKRRKSRS